MGEQSEEVGRQGGLFPDLPVRARRCDPMSESADCRQVCKCDDGSEYAIKEAETFPTMPHNEWICAKLAERVGIAAPLYRVVDVRGVPCFGSRWQAGEEANWWNRAFSGHILFGDLAPGISRVLALDLFVHNGDRHLKNYFVHKQKIGWSVLAMDFGRAWLFNGMPLPSLPMAEDENTVGDYRKLRSLFGDFIDHSEVDDVCDRLQSVTVEEIEQFISSHPKEWLPDSDKDTILNWWNSQERTDRIACVREGIKDGSFL